MLAPTADVYSGIVTVLAVLLYVYMGSRVGRLRGRHNIVAPAIAGHPEFDRAARVHGNTLEQLTIFLPLLWLATHFFPGPAWLPAAVGGVFLVGRVLFMRAYMADPAKRLPGVVIGMLAHLGLLVLASIGLFDRIAG